MLSLSSETCQSKANSLVTTRSNVKNNSPGPCDTRFVSPRSLKTSTLKTDSSLNISPTRAPIASLKCHPFYFEDWSFVQLIIHHLLISIKSKDGFNFSRWQCQFLSLKRFCVTQSGATCNILVINQFWATNLFIHRSVKYWAQ